MFLLGRAPVIAIGLAALIATALADPAPTGNYMPGPIHMAEARSQQLCESQSNRVFVSINNVSECVAYSVTPGNEDRGEAVFFFDGDPPSQVSAKAYSIPTCASTRPPSRG
jgi:hypothetical protein